MKKKMICAAMTLLLLVQLCACAKSETTTESTTTTQTGQTVSARDDVVIGVCGTLESLDPKNAKTTAEQDIDKNIFDPLIEYTDGAYQGCLAESYEMSEDGLELTVTLRSDVKFHNGDLLTPEDVAYTINALPESPALMSPEYQSIAGCEVVDDKTVIIRANSKTASFMVALTKVMIMSKRAVDELGADYAYTPVGTGAYKVVSFNGSDTFTLEANEDYFRGAPTLKKAQYRFIADEQSLIYALQAGEVDIVNQVSPAMSMQLENDTNFVTRMFDTGGCENLIFNCSKAPFDNKLVRQAVSYAVDREAYNLITSEGKNRVWDALYCESSIAAPDYDALPHYTYDLEKAKSLMAEAGYADGITLDYPITLTTGSETAATVIQQSLASIGITAEISAMEQNAFYNLLFGGEFNLIVSGLSGDRAGNADMVSTAQFFYSAAVNGESFCLPKYNNYDWDEMINEAAASNDLAERKAIYTDLYTQIFDEVPIATLAAKSNACISVKGLESLNPDDVTVRIRNLYWN